MTGWLFQILLEVLRLYQVLLIVRVLLSWVEPNPYNPVVRFILNITEPMLSPLRQLIPGVPLGSVRLDLSPLIAFFLLDLARQALGRIAVAL